MFVLTWASVAAAKASARLSRSRSDAGLALDELLALVRAQGVRIGCVVDEAHHGFHKDTEARRFFASVLRPDYTLMMTATPRDADVASFARDTGWEVADSQEWITLARIDGVERGLLKRGIKLVRFVAPNDDLATLVDYERTALAQFTEMHRHLKRCLQERGIALTPLMLVQVPSGDKAMQEARRVLTSELGFAESAVRIHTAREPDPDLLELAQNPSVEVLIFKMAVALGFDAPRAHTLAALRGARDKDFGIQVIGRLMRVHPLLRHRPELPEELGYGFVFLANSEAQEGLLDAGSAIAKLSTQAPELGSQTVVTVIGSSHSVQVLRLGETASLLPPPLRGQRVALEAGAESGASDPDLEAQVAAGVGSLPLFGGGQLASTPAPSAPPSLASVLIGDARQHREHRLRDDVPRQLVSETLPLPEGCIEERIADLIDFSPARLGAMHQTLVRLLRLERDVFASDIQQERQAFVQAQLDAGQLAAKVEQQLSLFDVDAHQLLNALARRFVESLQLAGIPAPEDPEAIDHALDLVLVRHPRLLPEAIKRVRMQRLQEREIGLPAFFGHPERLTASRRNAYGVYPPGFDSTDERDFAALLDASEDVLWWHRNPVKRPESVALYRWNDGAAFYPDFVVAVRGRETRDHIALVEIKGPRGWGDPKDVRKADGPAHGEYGRCCFVGREPRGDFQLLRVQGDRLEAHSEFRVRQLVWVER